MFAGKRPADFAALRVALVHYWFVTWRGGEKVVASILKLFPRADIYTLFYDEATCGEHLQGRRVRTSILDRRLLRSHHQKVYPLYPLGVRSWRLARDYDLVISSESGPAKGIRIPNRAPHLCYVHTPMRYCWGFADQYLRSVPRALRGLARWRLAALRRWDETTIDNVDRYVANSENVRERIRRHYGREAAVCHPPIAANLFELPLKPPGGEYYLSFGALTPYKNVGLLVEHFNATGEELVVIGSGSEEVRLRARAAPNIRFLGYLPTEAALEIARGAKALLFPGEEDFGMVPLEMMAIGLPVIALGKGGALETVVENRQDPARSSGLFFAEATPASLAEALSDFAALQGRFDPRWIREHARRFAEDRFLDCFAAQVAALLTRIIHESPTAEAQRTPEGA